MASTSLPLLDNVTGGGISGSSHIWPGGEGIFSAAGTFGGGTVRLQFLGPNESTWIDAGSSAFISVAGGCVFSLAPGLIRATIAGSSSAMYAKASTTR